MDLEKCGHVIWGVTSELNYNEPEMVVKNRDVVNERFSDLLQLSDCVTSELLVLRDAM